MGDDISSGLWFMAVCFDFRSTNVVQLSNHPLITQLTYGYNKFEVEHHQFFLFLQFWPQKPYYYPYKLKCEIFGFYLLSFPLNERKIYQFCSVSFCLVCIFLREVCLLFIIQKLKSKHTSLKKYSN